MTAATTATLVYFTRPANTEIKQNHKSDFSTRKIKILVNSTEDRMDIIWSGRPRQGVFFYPLDAVFVPPALGVFGFAIVSYFDTPAWPYLFMAALAFQLSTGRFLTAAFRRKWLSYTVTADSVVVKLGALKKRQVVLRISDIEGIGVNCDFGRYGDVIFFGGNIPSIGFFAPSDAEGQGRGRDMIFERIESV